MQFSNYNTKVADLTEPVKFYRDGNNVQTVKIITAKVNEQIKTMTSSWRRQHLVTDPGYKVEWSSHDKIWRVTSKKKQRGDEVYLDSNAIFVPGTKDIVTYAVMQLDPLPLYSGSTEAVSEGVTSVLDSFQSWTKRMTDIAEEKKSQELNKQSIPEWENPTEDESWENDLSALIFETRKPGYKKYYYITEKRLTESVDPPAVLYRSKEHVKAVCASPDHWRGKRSYVYRVVIPKEWKTSRGNPITIGDNFFDTYTVFEVLHTRKSNPHKDRKKTDSLGNVILNKYGKPSRHKLSYPQLIPVGSCGVVKQLDMSRKYLNVRMQENCDLDGTRGLDGQIVGVSESIKRFNEDPYR